MNTKYKTDEANKPLKVQKTYQLMAKPKEREWRLQSRSCDIISMQSTVLEQDAKVEAQMSQSQMIDINVHRAQLVITQYQSYAEVMVFTRLTTTKWDDSVNLRWEDLQAFFKFFGHHFDPISFLKKGGFTERERFIFYNMIGECLTLDPERHVELHFGLEKLVAEKLLYD